MRVYVIGAVTGIADDNRPLFEEWRTLLEGNFNCKAEIPHDTIPAGTPWRDAMRQSIKRMMEADFVAAIEGWRESKGATIELNLARELGIPTIELGGGES